MRLWPVLYRLLGGRGPDEQLRDARLIVNHEPPASWLARQFVEHGLLRRDATLPDYQAGWYINFQWQCRFWRGAYWACLERDRDNS